MNTIVIDRKQCLMIAHRGVSGLERENTCPAFIAAAVKSYYGIETDVHVTADGKYIICHDGDLKRVAGVDMVIEKSSYADLRAVRLPDTDGMTYRSDLLLPSLEDYIAICRKYDKVAVLELKEDMEEKHIANIAAVVKDMGWLNKTKFISFSAKNLVCLRGLYPDVAIQFLTGGATEENLEFMKKYRFDADLWEGCITGEYIEKLHEAGLKVNCWTIDDPEKAKKLIEMGVDYMTTDILE